MVINIFRAGCAAGCFVVVVVLIPNSNRPEHTNFSVMYTEGAWEEMSIRVHGGQLEGMGQKEVDTYMYRKKRMSE